MIWSEMTKEQRIAAIADGFIQGMSASDVARWHTDATKGVVLGYLHRYRDAIEVIVRAAGKPMPEPYKPSYRQQAEMREKGRRQEAAAAKRAQKRSPAPRVKAATTVFRAPAIPAKTLPPVPSPSGVPFLDRQRNQCAMPKWSDTVPARAIGVSGLFVCGKPTVHHTSWCADCLPKTMSAKGNANFALKLKRIAKRDRASRSNPPRVQPALTPPEGTAGVSPTRGATAGPDVFPAPSSGPAL